MLKSSLQMKVKALEAKAKMFEAAKKRTRTKQTTMKSTCCGRIRSTKDYWMIKTLRNSLTLHLEEYKHLDSRKNSYLRYPQKLFLQHKSYNLKRSRITNRNVRMSNVTLSWYLTATPNSTFKRISTPVSLTKYYRMMLRCNCRKERNHLTLWSEIPVRYQKALLKTTRV